MPVTLHSYVSLHGHKLERILTRLDLKNQIYPNGFSLQSDSFSYRFSLAQGPQNFSRSLYIDY